jgi:alpha-D-ribose 1-methylphosphonate 5-triphosphate synthase subunit PhnG
MSATKTDNLTGDLKVTRKRRTRILVLGGETLRKKLADEIRSKYDVKEIESPNNGLVMMQMREGARNGLFYLGELLVTEAKVGIGDVFGLGIVSGDAQDAALDLAVIDAACNAALPETTCWEAELSALEREIEAKMAAEDASVSRTSVNFETMDV